MHNLGKIDTITKAYMKNPVIFADAFNQYLYHGKQKIRPESLSELDATELIVPYAEGGAGAPEQKYRDVLKVAMTDGNVAYCILGCENQNDINYAMPVKNMSYDALQLSRQVAKAARSHRQKKGGSGTHEPTSEEFLSGFYKTDRLIPVVTLTILWGPEEWDGPLSLKEMYAETDEAIMRYAPDYHVNLIAPGQMTEEEIKEFKSSLKEVMLYIKYSKDKVRLQEVTQSEPNFQRLDREAAEVINVTTNSKLKYPEGEEAVNVCAALEEMREDSRLEGIHEGRLEGRLEGAVKTYKEIGFTQQETAQRIAINYNLTMQESKEKVDEYWR